MIILIHVIIALSSLAATTASVISPTQARLRTSYSLVAATLISGTYLVLGTHANILEACLTGLGYLAVALTGLFSARRRLANQSM